MRGISGKGNYYAPLDSLKDGECKGTEKRAKRKTLGWTKKEVQGAIYEGKVDVNKKVADWLRKLGKINCCMIHVCMRLPSQRVEVIEGISIRIKRLIFPMDFLTKEDSDPHKGALIIPCCGEVVGKHIRT